MGDTVMQHGTILADAYIRTDKIRVTAPAVEIRVSQGGAEKLPPMGYTVMQHGTILADAYIRTDKIRVTAPAVEIRVSRRHDLFVNQRFQVRRQPSAPRLDRKQPLPAPIGQEPFGI